jgi:hypothetical protein
MEYVRKALTHPLGVEPAKRKSGEDWPVNGLLNCYPVILITRLDSVAGFECVALIR